MPRADASASGHLTACRPGRHAPPRHSLEDRDDAADRPVGRHRADGVQRRRARQREPRPAARPGATPRKATPTTSNWPTSTPTLKVSSATGRWLLAAGRSPSARRRSPGRAPGRTGTPPAPASGAPASCPSCSASPATSMIDSAIVASTGGGRSVSQPSALQRQRQAVRHRERGDGPHQPAVEADQEQQRRSRTAGGRSRSGCARCRARV